AALAEGDVAAVGRGPGRGVAAGVVQGHGRFTGGVEHAHAVALQRVRRQRDKQHRPHAHADAQRADLACPALGHVRRARPVAVDREPDDDAQRIARVGDRLAQRKGGGHHWAAHVAGTQQRPQVRLLRGHVETDQAAVAGQRHDALVAIHRGPAGALGPAAAREHHRHQARQHLLRVQVLVQVGELALADVVPDHERRLQRAQQQRAGLELPLHLRHAAPRHLRVLQLRRGLQVVAFEQQHRGGRQQARQKPSQRERPGRQAEQQRLRLDAVVLQRSCACGKMPGPLHHAPLMNADPSILYAAHLDVLKGRADAALEPAGLDHLVVPSGTLHYQVFDDRDYPYAVNPQFKAWLPLVRNPGSWLVYTPGQRPRLVYLQPRDYWHVVPEAPSGYW